jgi:hypothetical protein
LLVPGPGSYRALMPKTKLNAEHRRALALLAESADGCIDDFMLVHGFTLASIVELVRAGHASAKTEHVRAGRSAIDVNRIRITEAGRAALAENL